jgi:hypothetical protein
MINTATPKSHAISLACASGSCHVRHVQEFRWVRSKSVLAGIIMTSYDAGSRGI